ncbi:hypothetical protein GCM10009754_22160 [Amycolatopsis minnesotensis]|uniref:Uncharacterized protein n=1 Tax=Amycolatopsis minnesotensis TaxID=337894 RepID=A0ABN2QIQ1_9PSEU
MTEGDRRGREHHVLPLAGARRGAAHAPKVPFGGAQVPEGPLRGITRSPPDSTSSYEGGIRGAHVPEGDLQGMHGAPHEEASGALMMLLQRSRVLPHALKVPLTDSDAAKATFGAYSIEAATSRRRDSRRQTPRKTPSGA